MIVRLGALLGLWPAVWTQSTSGNVSLRAVTWRKPRNGPFENSDSDKQPGWVVFGICCRPFFLNKYENACRILPDGTFAYEVGERYQKRWKEWKYNRKHVVFPEGE
jgi:hypothetical protein